MRRFIAVFFCCVFAASAEAGVKKNEECIFAQAKPVIDRRDKTIRSYKIKRSSQQAVETLVLSDGLKVTAVVGGCDHFGISITFESFPLPTKRDPVSDAAMVRPLLARVPVTAAGTHWKTKFDKALSEVTKEGNEDGRAVSLSCGGDECVLVIDQNGKVTLSFSRS